jgi:hypothetical protein
VTQSVMHKKVKKSEREGAQVDMPVLMLSYLLAG